ESPARADYVLQRIDRPFPGPVRASRSRELPRELLNIGIWQHREVLFDPSRVIHRVVGVTVYALLIADGQRDMRALLERHLLQP
ncbi:MAG: type II toxin-antitoxin system RelE/ParE family toxin, partial [Gammaproteobacteria bacterium]|nr:type II toxin-antitoxin system RelE/ParE family toxin [Gammaproteobacteria bacterium]